MTSTAPIRGCSPVCSSMSMSWIAAGHEPLERLGHRLVLAGQREDRPVVARVARPVEEVDARDARDRRRRGARRRRGGGPRRRSGRTRSARHDASRPTTASWPGQRAAVTRDRADGRLRAVTQPTRSLLRHADFLKLWTAETISQFGTQVSLLAIPLIAVTLLDATPFEVALLGTIEFLPFILFSLPAGAWVDRLRRRPILIAGDIGRAAMLVSIPIAFAFDALTIWQLYVVGFVNGTLTVFFDVAYQSYLPSLVERDQLVEGNSKLEITRSLAQTAGPALGGGLIGVLTGPVRDPGRLDQLRRLGVLRVPDPAEGADAGSPRRRARPGPRGTAQGSRDRPALRPRQPLPARHRGDHRHLEPVQQHRLRDVHRLRGPRAATCRRPRSASSSASATSGSARRRHRRIG